MIYNIERWLYVHAYKVLRWWARWRGDFCAASFYTKMIRAYQ